MNNKTNKINSQFLLLNILVLLGFLKINAQNTCATAVPITAGINTITAIDGTNINTSCDFGLLAEWYTYTPIADKRVTITSDLAVNICKDTYLNVYAGNCTALTCLASDDDLGIITCNSGANTDSFLSKITFDAIAGITYYINWSNRWQALGFDFELIEQTAAITPCSTAQIITAGTTTIASITGLNQNTNCSSATAANWYKYIAPQTGLVTISSDLVQNICKNTNFDVYTGNCSGVLNCISSDDNSGILTCSNNNLSNLSKSSFGVTQGVAYYISWDNTYSTDGFDFTLTETAFPCQNATPITSGITNVPAITGVNIVSSCSQATLANWYSYTPTSDYKVTITSDLAGNICKNTNLSIFGGNCPSAITCFQSDDDSGIVECTNNNTSLLSSKTFNVLANKTYFIVWDNKWSSDGFNFELNEAAIVVPVQYTIENIPTINSNYNNCIVDMNNDYKDDIVGISTGSLKIHFQNQTGPFTINSFSHSGTRLPDWSVAAGDYNKDGFNDLIIGNGQGASFIKSNFATNYTSSNPLDYIFCQRTNFIDLNNDGNLDAFSCHDIAPNVYFINDGAGNLTYNQCGVTPNSYSLGTLAAGGNYASLFTDYDNDGDQDLFISKCSGPPSELHRNDGNGVYTDISALAQINVTPMESWSSAIDDFDNDGDMDIMIGTNGQSRNRFFRNNLDKTNTIEEPFTEITVGSGLDENATPNRDFVSYDFDNDGKVDILSSGNKIMFNKGNNIFEPTFYSSMGVGAIGDLNGDGFLDIQRDDTILYAIPNGNNWIKIAYSGVESNKNGIGARVELYGTWGKQIRDVRSGEGFEYMSTLNTHFGIGTATAIEKVIIKWPSGKVDQINNPAINQTLVVVEGITLANSNFEKSSFSISPNPANDKLQFSFNTNKEIIEAQIVDITGKIISNPLIINNTIDVKLLDSGFYFLVLKDKNNKQYTSKFIKQ